MPWKCSFAFDTTFTYIYTHVNTIINTHLQRCKHNIIYTWYVSLSLLAAEFCLPSIHNTAYLSIQCQLASLVSSSSSLSLTKTKTSTPFVYHSIIYSDHVVRKCHISWSIYYCPYGADVLAGTQIRLYYENIVSLSKEDEAPHGPHATPPPFPY